MIRSYLKIAFRNLKHQKLISAINISGLALGLAVCLLIGLWLRQELQFDAFHNKAERIVLFQQFEKSAGSGSGFAPLIQRQISQVEKVVRLVPARALLSTSEVVFAEDRFYFADSTLFDVFTLQMLEGNPQQALASPYSVMLSEKMATKYFPGQRAVGQTLRYNNKQELVVAGVFKELPSNSHLSIDFISAFRHADEFLEEQLTGYWDNRSLTYLLLSEGTNLAMAEGQLQALKAKTNDQNSAVWRLKLLPLKDLYLHHQLDNRVKANGAIEKVYLFSAIAFFVLLLACFNYVNLATARATLRAKEVGVRKTIGASRAQLFWQFLCESVINIALATAGGVVLAIVVLPYFNSLTGTAMALTQLLDFSSILIFIGLLLVLCLLNGSYPALVLSAYKPVESLKNQINVNRKGLNIRQVLVVGQFAVSVTIIIATFIVAQQIYYMQQKDLGYEQEQVLTISFPGKSTADQRLLLKQQLLALSDVENASLTSSVPGSGTWFNKLVLDYLPEGTTDAGIQQLFVDQNFLELFDIKLVEGRNFRSGEASSGPVYLINQAAKDFLQWDKAEGKEIGYYTYAYSPEGGYTEMPQRGPVVGVVANYHQVNLKSKIAPLLIVLDPQVGTQLAVKLRSGQISGRLNAVEKSWKQLFPDQPFEYTFLDDAFAQTYQQEIRTAKVITIFAALTILISCMGLYGLATFTIAQRTKEIGIRKLLGASVSSMVALLSKDLLKLVVLAILLAIPIAWYFMDGWLQDFAYRIDISWWIFVLAGLAAVAIALITVSFHAIKAALRNPVRNLRTE